jgi:2-phospho-L-lactate guanylyltransferase
MLWALVPLKELTLSKQRLETVLEPNERQGLVLAMARDVLTVLRRNSAIDGVLLVSRTPEAQQLSKDCGVELFAESRNSDLSEALTQASRFVVRERGAAATLVVPSDVPLIRDNDIQAVLNQRDGITLVPDNSEEGTNALLMSPPELIDYVFGEHSFRHHSESSHAAGVSPLIVRNEHLARDIDVPDDLVALLGDLPQSATRDYLLSNGLG